MKIEHVRFDNINSLCGHFEVDFTHPSLTDPGIFVITGPTGVGKTSLLDAVSFALYGRTARQKGVTGDRDELMTRGASFCRAELRFEKDARHYLVATEHRRKRSGDGFMQQERKLEEILPDGTTQLLANQVKEVTVQVEKITGLGYENFFRCMMLAQGKFAQFMEADAPRRSEVLSTITGTEIYQAVGETVFEHCTALEKELAAIQWKEVMSEEERLQVEESLRANEKAQEEAKTALTATETALKWLQDIGEQRATVEKCSQNLQNAQRDKDAFVEDGSDARLQAAESALKVQPFQVKRDSARKAVATTETERQTESDWLAAHQQEMNDAILAESDALAAQKLAQPVLEAVQKHLREVVRPLENEVNQAAAALATAKKYAKNAAGEVTKAVERRDKAKTGLTKAETAAQKAAEALDKLKADSILVETMPGIRQRFKDWATCPGSEQEIPDSATLQERSQAVEQEKTALLDGRKETELPLLAERLKQLVKLVDAEKKARTAVATAELAAKKAAAAVAALASVEDAEALYRSRCEATRLASQVAGLEEKLNTIYLDFKAGKYECCPCCGSPTPHERHVAPGQLQALQAEETAALEEWKQRRSAAETARQNQTKADTLLTTARQTADTAKDNLDEAIKAQGLQEVPDDLQEQTDAMDSTIQRLAELQQESAQLATMAQVDAKRALFLAEISPCTEESPQDVETARQIVATLEKRLKAYTAASELVSNTAEKVKEQQSELTHATEALQQAEKANTQATQDVSDAQSTLQTQQEALQKQWQGGTVDMEECILRHLVAAFEKQCKATKTVADGKRTVFARHQTLFKSAEERLPDLRTACQDAESDMQEELAQAGFENETAYTEALVYLPEREGLRKRRQKLDTAWDTCNGAADTARETLEKLESRALTQESAETLEEKKEAQQVVLQNVGELVTDIRARIIEDNKARLANREKEEQAAGIKQSLRDWDELRDILGKTRDGFKKYAQQITFEILVQHANAQLRKLSERYTLISDPEQELSLRVLDRCQDEDGGRSCSNLSGGETFIISLALALGLSRMAGSKTSIDTLFLDEGFGTLDDATLERVLSSLQTLRAGGKLVGIISHVEKLQARLSANIALEHRGSTGLSTFRPHPAVVAKPTTPAAAVMPTKAEQRKEEAEAARRESILQALAAGPLIEKEIGLAIGNTQGNRAILKAMVDEGLLTYEKPRYRLAGE